MTYTYAIMEVSLRVYEEIRLKLEAAGYSDQIDAAGNLDMHGIALAVKHSVSAARSKSESCR